MSKKYDIRPMAGPKWKFAICSRRGNHQVALCKTKATADRIVRGLEREC